MIFDTSPFFFEPWTHPQNWHSYYHQHFVPRRRIGTTQNWEPIIGDWGNTNNDSEGTRHYRLGESRTIPIEIERADPKEHETKVYYELSDNDDDDSYIEILTPQEVDFDFNNSASTNNRKRRKSVTQQTGKLLLERGNASNSSDEVVCKDVNLQHANFAEGARRRNVDNNDKVFSISFVQDNNKRSSPDKAKEKPDAIDICDDLSSSSSTDLKYKLEENEKEINATPSYTIYSYLSEFLMQSGRQIDYIRGDGNCFFRALSKVVYGTESCHKQIREAVVDVIKKYPKKFEAYLDLDEGGIRNHTQEMRQLGTWATQTEIYAAATLLQRDIYVLSPDPSGDNYKWLLFTPVFHYSGDISYHPCFITLCHTNGNHYDRVATIEGKCNCNIDPPELSGINAAVDLASEIV